MNANLQRVQDRLLGLYHECRESMDGVPASDIEELRHQVEHALNHQDWTARTAAEIIRTACTMELEARRAH